MSTRFICRYCRQEVEVKRIYTSPLTIGRYAECPKCGAENEIKEIKLARKELDVFDEEEDYSISSA